MKGSPALDSNHPLQSLIIEHLTDRAPTISARRATELCQKNGHEVVHDDVVNLLEQLVQMEQITRARRGVYKLVQPAIEAEDVDRPEASAERTLEAAGSSPNELAARELDLIRRYLGKRSSPNARLSRDDLENAQRVASFLAPYPVAPVDLEDVISLEKGLGQPRAQEALWLHLQREVNVVCDLFNVAYAPSPTSPSQGLAVHHKEPPKTTQRAEPSPSCEADRGHPTDKRSRDRQPEGSSPPETRHPAYTAQHIYDILKKARGSLAIEELFQALSPNERPKKRSLYELRRELIDLNRKAEYQGERPPFTFGVQGEVGLSEWGVSSAMRASEGRVARELEVYREQLYMALAERLHSLLPPAFEQLLSRLLSERGCEYIESLNAPQADGVALIARHPEWGECLVLAHRSRKPLSRAKVREVGRSLSSLQAERAILISLAGFSSDVEPSPHNVQLLGERDLLKLMVSHNVGVAQYSLPLSFVDAGFFNRLDEEVNKRPHKASKTGGD